MTRKGTTTRDRHRAHHRQAAGPCGICGGAIDYSLPYLHPMSFVVDHVIPINRGGLDVLDNTISAHRSCNRSKGDRLPGDVKPRLDLVPFRTSRKW